MGILGCSTPGTSVNVNIPRINVQPKDLSEIGKINLRYYKVPEHEVSSLQFKELSATGEEIEKTFKLDLLSKVIWPLRTFRPSWSGFMQLYHNHGDYPGKSTIGFMPMIDMNSSDLSCINSTLHFVCEQSVKYNVAPVVTFDQPLFWKATTIINGSSGTSPLRKIVLRLGGFHTEMSFLGSIGHLMMGSGLQDLLETVYAPNAVIHMFTGKAVARAVRGHFLIDTALHAILLSRIFNNILPEPGNRATEASEDPMEMEIPSSDQEDHFEIPQAIKDSTEMNVPNSCQDTENDDNKENTDTCSSILHGVAQLYDSLTEENISLEEIYSSEKVHYLHQKVNEEKQKLTTNSTAALWLQYMDLQTFIRAERTGNWQQHLLAVRKMLPYFAASGHTLYLKSAYIYISRICYNFPLNIQLFIRHSCVVIM